MASLPSCLVTSYGVHETPDELACALASYVPEHAKHVLDPCGGNGALLRPLLFRNCSLYAVDVRADASVSIRRNLSAATKLHVIADDFLSLPANFWPISMDCVVMNPPFCGKKAGFVLSGVGASARITSKEVSFLRKAREMVRPGGRIVAIVPPSLICGSQFKWFREEMCSIGTVRIVHELPPFTFRNVESRVYILVWDLNPTTGGKTLLLNHSITDPDRLSISKALTKAGSRLDYGYHHGLRQFNLLTSTTALGSRSLGETFEILRGSLETPAGKACGVHTCDGRGQVWDTRGRVPSKRLDQGDKIIRKGDLLLKRVARNALRSCGSGRLCEGKTWTDCVFVLRPRYSFEHAKALLLVRVILGLSWVEDMLAKGAGSQFISKSDLEPLPLPWRLLDNSPSLVRDYRKALAASQMSMLDAIEARVRASLSTRIGKSF